MASMNHDLTDLAGQVVDEETYPLIDSVKKDNKSELKLLTACCDRIAIRSNDERAFSHRELSPCNRMIQAANLRVVEQYTQAFSNISKEGITMLLRSCAANMNYVAVNPETTIFAMILTKMKETDEENRRKKIKVTLDQISPDVFKYNDCKILTGIPRFASSSSPCHVMPRVMLQQRIGMPKSRCWRPSASRKQQRPYVGTDPEFPEDHTPFELNDPRGLLMPMPFRSLLLDELDKLQAGLRKLLKDNVSVRIPSYDVLRTCLKDRLGEVTRTGAVNGEFWLSDSNGRMFVHWKVRKQDPKFLSPEETIKRIELATGFIRDQDTHPLCWAYALNDLISASLVLHGWEKNYIPLSQLYLCQNVDKAQYGQNITEKSNLDHEETHSCYTESMHNALKFVIDSGGVPKASPEELIEPFNCNVPRRPVPPREKKYPITGAFRYDTLEDALERLKTHPVYATLTCFLGWEEPGVYVGPNEKAPYEGTHGVIMLDCREEHGTMFIRCKSSNSEITGNKGYIYVSTEVMFINVGGTRENDEYSCPIKPQYLLSEFYSVDMSMGPNPLIKETDEQRRKNLNFNVHFEQEAAKDGSSGSKRRGMSREVKEDKEEVKSNFEPQLSFAWISQHILGISLIKTVLQIVRVPNLKVGFVLLCCAFMYEIFWGFVSKWWFRESVTIVVARGERIGEDGIPMPRMFSGGYNIIGFGDIILLGLLVAFALRLANKKLKSGYFLGAMSA